MSDYQEQELLTKYITINDRAIKDGNNGQYAKIKDEKGLTYTVSELKKDGTKSKAWANMPKKGQVATVGYVEVERTFTDDQGKEKPYKARYVRFFEIDPDGEPILVEPRQGRSGGGSDLKPKPKPDRI